MSGPAANGRGRPVLVVTNDRGRPFQRAVLAGAAEIAAGAGLELTVHETRAERPGPAAPDACGVLVIADALGDAALRDLRAAGLPVTLVSHRREELGIPSVQHDNLQGMTLLMRHVLGDLGRRRPLFLRGSDGQNDGRERLLAYRREMLRADAGPADHLIRPGGFDPERAAASVREALADGLAFDAVVAADYLMALAAVRVLEGAGVRVPDAVAVAGFGDGPEAADAGLTTVAADVVELGRRAARQLLAQAAGRPVRGLTLLSTTLVPRGSSVGGR